LIECVNIDRIASRGGPPLELAGFLKGESVILATDSPVFVGARFVDRLVLGLLHPKRHVPQAGCIAGKPSLDAGSHGHCDRFRSLGGRLSRLVVVDAYDHDQPVDLPGGFQQSCVARILFERPHEYGTGCSWSRAFDPLHVRVGGAELIHIAKRLCRAGGVGKFVQRNDDIGEQVARGAGRLLLQPEFRAVCPQQSVGFERRLNIIVQELIGPLAGDSGETAGTRELPRNYFVSRHSRRLELRGRQDHCREIERWIGRGLPSDNRTLFETRPQASQQQKSNDESGERPCAINTAGSAHTWKSSAILWRDGRLAIERKTVTGKSFPGALQRKGRALTCGSASVSTQPIRPP
jgi:hypothetical protein